MKNNTLKSILSSILVISLCISLIAGSTFALFTSESKVNVAVTAGNVDVVATVDRDSIVKGSTLGTNLEETVINIDDENNIIALNKIVPGDYVEFDLVIKNNSDVTVKYRTVITKVEDDGLWDGLEVTIGETIYDGTSKVSKWETLAPESDDIRVSVKVALPVGAGNEYESGNCTFAYTVEAVQGNADVTDAPENNDSSTTAYYTVATAEELKALVSQTLPDGAIIDIVSNIDFGNEEFPAIGAAYGGTLTVNGNGNVISNVSVKTPGKQNGMDNYGMFYVHTNGTLTINHLTINGAKVEAKANEVNYGAAVIVGYADENSTVNLNNVDVKNSEIVNSCDEAAVFVSYCRGNINMTNCDAITCTVQGGNTITKTSIGIGHLNGGTAILKDCTEDNATYDWCHRNDGNLIIIKNGVYDTTDGDTINLAFNNGASIVKLSNDVDTTAPVYVNGGILDGNGNTINATNATTSSWPNAYAVTLGNGGTLKNATVIKAGYAIGSTAATEDVYINNVTTDYVTYAINGNGNGTNSVYVADSTINGWISYSNIDKFVFTNCTLAKGNSYDGYLVVYGDTSFTNCTFDTFTMGAREQGGEVVAEGDTVEFTNCSYVTKDGTEKVTAENFKTLFMAEGDEVDFGNLAKCNVVIDGVAVAWN